MEKDAFDDFGLLALGSRLRRASDRFMVDVARIYRDNDIDFAPRGFPLLRLLDQSPGLGVGEVAEALGLSQPAVSQLVRDLTRSRLVASDPTPGDERRRSLRLTERGQALVERARPIWRDVEAAVAELIYEADVDMLTTLRRVEAAVARQGLFERVAARRARPEQQVVIVDYAPALRDHWRRLTEQWLTHEYRDFGIEDYDRRLMDDPEGEVLAGGGAIVFARLGDDVVGTGGLLRLADGRLELIKMGVAPQARGLGVGRRLAERLIALARERGADRLVLESNRRARAAIRLYESLGFRHLPNPNPGHFVRTDVYMEMPLGSAVAS